MFLGREATKIVQPLEAFRSREARTTGGLDYTSYNRSPRHHNAHDTEIRKWDSRKIARGRMRIIICRLSETYDAYDTSGREPSVIRLRHAFSVRSAILCSQQSGTNCCCGITVSLFLYLWGLVLPGRGGRGSWEGEGWRVVGGYRRREGGGVRVTVGKGRGEGWKGRGCWGVKAPCVK